MKTKILMFSLLFMFILGCKGELRLTRDEWIERMPPPETVEEGEALAVLNTKLELAKAKVKSLESLDRFKIMCAAGAVASLFAIGLGVKALGTSGLLACIGGFVLAYAGSEHAKILGYVGLLVGVAAGVYATYSIVMAIKQIVVGNEKFKDTADGTSVELFNKAQGEEQKNSFTKKLVDKIQKHVV